MKPDTVGRPGNAGMVTDGLLLRALIRSLSLQGVLVLVVACCPAPAAHARHDLVGTGDAPAASRLAMQWGRTARSLVDEDTLTLNRLRAAGYLADEAARLARDDVDLWRLALNIAHYRDDTESAYTASREIIRLDPTDTVARLARLNAAIDRYEVVEDRLAAYRSLHDAGLSAALSSRLVLDEALLHRRRGDIDAFARCLREATELDPSNRAAAALAAGYFRMQTDDVQEEGTLLVNLLRASPLDLTTQVALAELLMRHGAYAGAARLYGMAIRTHEAGGKPVADDLLADATLSDWGNGMDGLAERRIMDHQRALNSAAHWMARISRPELTPSERMKIRVPMSPSLTVARAALLVRTSHEDAADAIEEALASYTYLLDGPDELLAEVSERCAAWIPPPHAVAATLHLEMAWICLWLMSDVDRAQQYLVEAESWRALETSARQRFDGWIALRRGDLAQAISILEPLSEQDPAARLGLARAYHLSGTLKAAARSYLVLARDTADSILGIWAAYELTGLLGRRVAVTTESSKLEELVAGIPQSYDTYPERPVNALELTLSARTTVFSPLAPVLLDISLINRSPVAMAIDRDGPVHPQLLFLVESNFQGRGLRSEVPPFVLDIGHRLRIGSNEQLDLTVDLRTTPVGEVLDRAALTGALLQVQVITNFTARTADTLGPGPLGMSVLSQMIRIEGISTSGEEFDTLLRTASPDTGSMQLNALALVGQLSSKSIEKQASGAQLQSFFRAQDTIIEAAEMLGPVELAWLVAIYPPGEMPDALRSRIQRNTERLVKISYLAGQLTSGDDPVLLAAMQSGDPTIRALAEVFMESLPGGDG